MLVLRKKLKELKGFRNTWIEYNNLELSGDKSSEEQKKRLINLRQDLQKKYGSVAETILKYSGVNAKVWYYEHPTDFFFGGGKKVWVEVDNIFIQALKTYSPHDTRGQELECGLQYINQAIGKIESDITGIDWIAITSPLYWVILLGRLFRQFWRIFLSWRLKYKVSFSVVATIIVLLTLDYTKLHSNLFGFIDLIRRMFFRD